MYCEWLCCFPCMFIMKTCDECYKALCCQISAKVQCQNNETTES